MTNKNTLLDTIFQLRKEEELVFYSFESKYSKEELQTVVDFLEDEYIEESLYYPNKAPMFNDKAAEWAALVVFRAGLLFLNRNEGMDKVRQLIKPYAATMPSVAEQLSADLMLRFLPSIITSLYNIDFEDPAIDLLNMILKQFPYSAIELNIIDEAFDYDNMFENSCFKQLYVDRIIALKASNIVSKPIIKKLVLESMGSYQNIYWNNL
jgi:hypothetical protein